MQELIRVTWCTPCFELEDDHPKVEGQRIIIGVQDGPEPIYTLDLCDQHREHSLPDLLELAEQYGEPYKPEGNGPKKKTTKKAAAPPESHKAKPVEKEYQTITVEGGVWRYLCPTCGKDYSTKGRVASHEDREHAA